MLQIYSDAAVRDRSCVATVIFTDDNIFEACICKVYEDISKVPEAEAMGIVQGLEWVLDNKPGETHVALYLDNISVAQKLCTYVETGEVSTSSFPSLWLHIYSLCDRIEKIEVYHIPAHQPVHNPNKVCDRLATAYLRVCTEGVDECTQLSLLG